MYDTNLHRTPRTFGETTFSFPPVPQLQSPPYLRYDDGSWSRTPRNSVSDAASNYSIESRNPSISSNASGEACDTSFLARISSFQRLAEGARGMMTGPEDYDDDNEEFMTLPSYAKVMHAFTLNQMRHQRLKHVCQSSHSKSANNSPALAPDLATNMQVIAAPMDTDVKQLHLTEGPKAPCNSPSCVSSRMEVDGQDGACDDQMGEMGFLRTGTRKRSATEPIMRDFAMNKVKSMMIV